MSTNEAKLNVRPIPVPGEELPGSVKSEPGDDSNISFNSIPLKTTLTGQQALEIIGRQANFVTRATADQVGIPAPRTSISMKCMAPESREYFAAQCEMVFAKSLKHIVRANKQQKKAVDQQRKADRQRREADNERIKGSCYMRDAYGLALKAIESPSVSPAEARAANRVAHKRYLEEFLEGILEERRRPKRDAETGSPTGTTPSANVAQSDTVEDATVKTGDEGASERKKTQTGDGSEAISELVTKK